MTGTSGADLSTTRLLLDRFALIRVSLRCFLLGSLDFSLEVKRSRSVERYKIRQVSLDGLEVILQNDLQVRVELALYLCSPYRHSP